VLDVAFLFQPAKQRLHGGVGYFSRGRQIVTRILDGGLIKLPN